LIVQPTRTELMHSIAPANLNWGPVGLGIKIGAYGDVHKELKHATGPEQVICAVTLALYASISFQINAQIDAKLEKLSEKHWVKMMHWLNF
jgi:hypothetical protein